MLYIDRKCVRGWGELTPDYEMILKEGVVGIEKRIHNALEKMDITAPGDYKKIKYLHSLLLVTEGLRQLGRRYSQKAAAMARTEADPQTQGRAAQDRGGLRLGSGTSGAHLSRSAPVHVFPAYLRLHGA